MFDHAATAVEAALEAGAVYTDARYLEARTETIEVFNGSVRQLDRIESAGVAVRALVGSSWGFFGTHDLSSGGLRGAGHRAAEIAKASAAVPGDPFELADVSVVEAEYETPHEESLFDVPLSE